MRNNNKPNSQKNSKKTHTHTQAAAKRNSRRVASQNKKAKHVPIKTKTKRKERKKMLSANRHFDEVNNTTPTRWSIGFGWQNACKVKPIRRL
jgi:hypothetical protein